MTFKTMGILLILTISYYTVRSQSLPIISLKDINNQYRDIQDLKGDKLTIIEFWTSWCKPCLKSMPELNNIYKNYKHKGVNVIGVNNDGPRSLSKVKPLVSSLNIEYPILFDTNTELMGDFNLSAYPSLIIIDNNGLLLWTHEGFVSGDEEIIRAAIEKHLSK